MLLAAEYMFGRVDSEVEVILAVCKDDLHNPGIDERVEASIKAFESHFTHMTGKAKLSFCFELTAKELLNFIPAEIKKLTISCRKPQYVGEEIVNCGNCESCKHNRKVEADAC
jgi:7-cyano-7-deazaguanine synthase in queuosine biosynthesis